MRLHIKLLLCIILPVAMATGISTYDNYVSNTASMQKITENALKSASFFLAENVSLTMANIRSTLFVITQLPAIHKNIQEKPDNASKKAMESFFCNIRDMIPSAKDIFLLDSQGNVLVSINEKDYGKNYSDRDYIQKTLLGESVIEGPIVSRATGKPSFFITVPVREKGVEWGNVLGVLVLSIQVQDFIEQHNINADILADAFVFLGHANNTVIILRSGQGQDLEQSIGQTLLNDTLVAGENQRLFEYARNGTVFIGSYAKINDLPWYVFSIIEKNVILENAAMSIGRTSAMTIIVILVITLIVMWVMGDIAYALKEIIRFAGDVSGGNLYATLHVQGGGDVGHLATSLRGMLESMQENQEKLQCAVDERTHELRLTMQKAHEASKAKSEFIARMNHEIRTPLNAVIGFAYLLHQTPLDGHQQDYLGKIEVAAKLLLAILNDILDFSNMESGNVAMSRTPLHLRTIMDNIVAVHEARAQTVNLKLLTDIDPHIPAMLLGDGPRIEHVLVNLVSNAIKFSDNGVVHIRATCKEKTDTRATLLFEVRDHGVGISREYIDNIFDTFAQADGSTTRTHGGTGLGLTISRMLVRLMGGEIWVRSVVNQETSFFFCLPLETGTLKTKAIPTAASVAVEAFRDTSASPAGNENLLVGKTVLLVEDNEINQEIAVEVLTQFGLAVDVAAHGRHALEKIRAGNYNLVLMDIQMPIMDGYETTRKLRTEARFAHLPIVAMTANVLDTDREQCLACGMNDHIGKPFEPEALRTVIEKWILR